MLEVPETTNYFRSIYAIFRSHIAFRSLFVYEFVFECNWNQAKKAYNLWAWNEYSDSKNWIVKQEKQSISTHKYCSSLVLSLAYWCECVFLYRALIYGENDFGHCKIKCSCVFDTILAHSEIEDETICTNELRMKYQKATTTTTEKCQPEKQTAKTREKVRARISTKPSHCTAKWFMISKSTIIFITCILD